ncbi:MAG: hypothetical protein ACR2KW_10155 [Rubrobacter sp.]
MGSEVVQFALMFGVFLVVLVAWLFIIYLPGRTMEGQWEGDRAERLERKAHADKAEDSGTTPV